MCIKFIVFPYLLITVKFSDISSFIIDNGHFCLLFSFNSLSILFIFRKSSLGSIDLLLWIFCSVLLITPLTISFCLFWIYFALFLCSFFEI